MTRTAKLVHRDLKSKVRSVASDKIASCICHQGNALLFLLFTLVMNAVFRETNRPGPYALLCAEDVPVTSSNKADLHQPGQKWNDHLKQHGLRLNLNKTEFLTNNPNQTAAAAWPELKFRHA